MSPWADRHVVVDHLRTHYLDAGEGPTLVLLHAGGFGENAELSWRHNIPALAERHRVIAPDWLGFGGSDKVRDFVRPMQRMVDHLARVCEALDITDADFAGLSMGGTYLVRAVATERPVLPVRRMVLVSGGGFSPDNDARKVLQGYDGSFEAMRRQLAVVFRDPRFAEDDDLVAEYHRASQEPGAWEFAASARLRSPASPERADFGTADPTPYELVAVPTLVTAGADDPLREPGYAPAIAARMPQGRAEVFEGCGHCPNVERPEEWNRLVLDFLS